MEKAKIYFIFFEQIKNTFGEFLRLFYIHDVLSKDVG